jgi:hypothetical protein
MRKLVGALAVGAAGTIGAIALAPALAHAASAPALERCGCDHPGGSWAAPGSVLDIPDVGAGHNAGSWYGAGGRTNAGNGFGAGGGTNAGNGH